MPEQLTNTDTHALLWPVCLLTDFLSAAFYVLYLPPFQLALLGEPSGAQSSPFVLRHTFLNSAGGSCSLGVCQSEAGMQRGGNCSLPTLAGDFRE